ncbi:unnamed protein product [Protopolystoma xenopodis]|uniref:Uncharacterized protein n=1 Tax=Protopolystoma xenopodis TaxID=117903 RepID=A0A448X6B6_9PLAT|nr:unnamed protein product [Protopolystoma xenopodis]
MPSALYTRHRVNTHARQYAEMRLADALSPLIGRPFSRPGRDDQPINGRVDKTNLLLAVRRVLKTAESSIIYDTDTLLFLSPRLSHIILFLVPPRTFTPSQAASPSSLSLILALSLSLSLTHTYTHNLSISSSPFRLDYHVCLLSEKAPCLPGHSLKATGLVTSKASSY